MVSNPCELHDFTWFARIAHYVLSAENCSIVVGAHDGKDAGRAAGIFGVLCNNTEIMWFTNSIKAMSCDS